MKGKYIIEKYAAEYIDGEWVKKELIDIIEEDNTLTPEWANKWYSAAYGEANSFETIIAVTEAIYDRPMTAWPNDTGVFGWTRPPGGPDTDAVFFPAAGMDDAYFEFISLINPPGSGTRNIRTICLSTIDTSDTNEVYSIVSLAAPCPQEDDEILQITYRLINDISTTIANSDVSARQAELRFEFGLFTVSGANNIYVIDGTPGVFGLSWDRSIWGTGIIERIGVDAFDDNEMSWTLGGSFADGGTRTLNLNARFGLNNDSGVPTVWTGFPLKGIGMGESALMHVGTVSKGTVSSVQNTFARAAESAFPGVQRRPFLNIAHIASSAAVTTIEDFGGWTNYQEDSYTMPWLYRITIEVGGDVGTATYKLRRRRLCFPYINSSIWEQNGLSIPTFDYNPPSTDFNTSDSNTNIRHGQHRWEDLTDNLAAREDWNNNTGGDAGTIVQTYNYPDMLCFDYDGLTIHSVTNEYINFDTNSTPALSVTEVLQCSTDGSTIYIADAATGLFMLQRDVGDFVDSNATITQLSPPGITDTTSCRGVHCGYAFQEGSVSNIRVVFGGSNYAAADTVTIAGANGTSATAEVATVNGDGAILTVKVTNPGGAFQSGTGYIMENIQAYVSTGNGVGAKLIPEVGSDMEMWALFDDTTDNFMYLAHATKIGSDDYTDLDFQTGADTITRTGGTGFLADGFRAGQKLFIKHAEDAGNNGVFTIASVDSETQMTITENLTTNADDTEAQIFAQKWEIMTETITTTETVTFATPANTITGSGTSYITQGFREGMEIVVSGSASNNSTFTVADVTATVITLDSEDTVVAEVGISCTIATLTDFTILDYTSGSPGRTGFIGLMWDREHADGRFAMLTPPAKVVNDGVSQNQAISGFDWWSFVNSTGTVSAGSTDRARSAVINEFSSVGGEQIATQCIVPLNNENLWICVSSNGLDSRSITWGTATTPDDGIFNGRVGTGRAANTTFKTKSMDSAVLGISTSTDADLVVRKNSAELANATVWDSLVCGQFPERGGSYSGSSETDAGAPLGYLGGGIFMSGMNSFPRGQFIYTFNADGRLLNEDLMPYGFWEEFGWDGSDWVLGNASARTTHAAVSFVGSNLNINHTAGTIVGTFSGTDWAGDGFEVGDTITIATAEDVGNNGSYVIESLSGTTLTITPYSNTLTDTNATDTAATVVGARALIDGLAVSFDDNGTTTPLVLDEFYDTHVYDGILCDNATNVTVDTIFYEAGGETGTDDYSSEGSPATVVPGSDTGAIVGELFSSMDHSLGFNNYWQEEPGKLSGGSDNNATNMHFGQQNIGTGDFATRWRQAGTTFSNTVRIGLLPWADIVLGTFLTNANLDWNIGVEYDFINNPTLDIYVVKVFPFGNTSINSPTNTENADRIVTIVAQDETDFDNSPTSEGTFIGGDGAGGTAHVAADVLTMDDGTTITVDTVDGNGDVVTFDITTSSTSTRGRGQVGIGANDYTDLALDSTGNPDTITRTDGTAFDADGFKVGMKIVLDAAEEPANNGIYTIEAVTATVITVTETIATTNTDDVTIQLNSAIVQTSSTGSGTDFALILGTDNEAAAALGTDVFSITRVGASNGNVRFQINGVEFYRLSGVSYNTDIGLGTTTSTGVNGHTINDWEIDYTKPRRTLSFGNGTTTGRAHVNYRRTAIAAIDTPDWSLQIDGVEATINQNGYTTPTAGQPTILASAGELWFNTADAGKTITGNWRTVFKVNMS